MTCASLSDPWALASVERRASDEAAPGSWLVATPMRLLSQQRKKAAGRGPIQKERSQDSPVALTYNVSLVNFSRARARVMYPCRWKSQPLL